MISSQLHPSLIECCAYVKGVSANKVRTLVSAKALPANGMSYRTLCKWPRLTARGYDDRGEFWWATVARNGDDTFIRPSQLRTNTVSSVSAYFEDIVSLFLEAWVEFWLMIMIVFFVVLYAGFPAK